jgi:N-methylhydantoinase B
MEIVDHEAIVTHYGDGTRFPPPSRLGGGSPRDSEHRLHRKYIIRKDGTRDALPLHSVLRVEAGERLLVFTPGGGGVGPAHSRPHELVAADARFGFITIDSARDEYGVAVDPETFAIDEEGTALLRSATPLA